MQFRLMIGTKYSGKKHLTELSQELNVLSAVLSVHAATAAACCFDMFRTMLHNDDRQPVPSLLSPSLHLLG